VTPAAADLRRSSCNHNQLEEKINTNARFEPITGETKFEVLAPETLAHYDPTNETGTVVFNAAKYLTVDGEYRTDIAPARCGSVHRTFDQIIPRLFAEGTELVDPVSGADLSKVSGAGIILYLKAAFDVLWNEEQRLAEPPAEDESSPEDEPQGEGDA
jgi:hypothetical protein